MWPLKHTLEVVAFTVGAGALQLLLDMNLRCLFGFFCAVSRHWITSVVPQEALLFSHPSLCGPLLGLLFLDAQSKHMPSSVFTTGHRVLCRARRDISRESCRFRVLRLPNVGLPGYIYI